MKKAQILLNGLGYSCGKADGDFGAKTEKAVIAYQKQFWTNPDGIVGEKTWAKLIG